MNIRLIHHTACWLGLFLIAAGAAADEESANPFFTKADELYVEGDVELALDLYKKGLELVPKNADARIRYASLLANLGQTAHAITAYEEGLSLNDSDATLHVRLADLLRTTGKLDDALRHYETAYQLAPESAAGVDAYVQIARISKASEDLDEGTAEIQWSEAGGEPSTTEPASSADLDPEALNQLALLRERLAGDWCLEWIDVYKKQGGVCRSQIGDGDYVFVDPPRPVMFRFHPDNQLAAAEGFVRGSGIDVTGAQTRSVDSEMADRSLIHTLNFTDGRYVEFHFNTEATRVCFQITAARRGYEQRECSDTYTVCQCSTQAAQVQTSTGG